MSNDIVIVEAHATSVDQKLEKTTDWRHRRDLMKARSHKARVYIFTEGESIMAMFGNRHFRPYELYREQVMPTIMSLLGVPDEEYSWSQKAGCSCGCSPGFILSQTRGKDVFVTVEGLPTENTPEARGKALERTAQLIGRLEAEKALAG